MIRKFTVSRDDSIYEAFPDVVLTRSGRLVCVFAECTHHADRGYTRLMLTDSTDRGRTWSPKRPLTPPRTGLPYWNCPRISALSDGRLVVVADCVGRRESSSEYGKFEIYIWFSADEGRTWTEPRPLPVSGIVPDQLRELRSGRWLLSCHIHAPAVGKLVQRLWYSDDRGETWQGPVTVGQKADLNLCEASILEVGAGVLVAFHRENSGLGWDCQKTISLDGGVTWSDPVPFPLPGCHRPVAGWLRDGRILITYRFMQGGKGWLGTWTQNFFAALTDRESALATRRQDAWTRILPLDYDRSPQSDLGYSGWAQFPDGEIYAVSYIVDDAPKAQIRGYSLWPEDFLIPAPHPESV